LVKVALNPGTKSGIWVNHQGTFQEGKARNRQFPNRFFGNGKNLSRKPSLTFPNPSGDEWIKFPLASQKVTLKKPVTVSNPN